MIRRVHGLEWASAITNPHFSKVKAKGAKAKGLRYERAVHCHLGSACLAGKWFQFFDRNGPGYCQPDFLLPALQTILVIEAKLTYTQDAWEQLEGLYLPVVARAMGKRTVGLQVTRNLHRGVPAAEICASLESAVKLALTGHRAVWHWLG